MSNAELHDTVEQLVVELTAQRLITRSIILHMITHSQAPVRDVLASLEEAITLTSPDSFPLPGVDEQLQARGSALARERARELFSGLGRRAGDPAAAA